MPVEVVGNPAAKRGADGGCDDYSHAVNSEGLTALLNGEGIGEDGLFAGCEATTADALQHAREDEEAQAGRKAAEHGAESEDNDAGKVKPFAPETVLQPAGDGKHDG